MTQETELPALPEPRRYGLLRPDGSIDESLIGSRADCEYWTRAEKEEQSGWEIVGIYTEHDMRAAVLAERERPQWQPIETAPSDVVLLLYSPHLNETNPERVEARVFHNTRGGSQHAWATHWMPLPPPPAVKEG